MRKTERAFGARSARSLIIAKFVPGLNTAAPPLAGVLRMPVGQFIGYSAAGAVVWSTAWVGVGFIFSEQLELAASYEARSATGSESWWWRPLPATSRGSTSRASAS